MALKWIFSRLAKLCYSPNIYLTDENCLKIFRVKEIVGLTKVKTFLKCDHLVSDQSLLGVQNKLVSLNEPLMTLSRKRCDSFKIYQFMYIIRSFQNSHSCLPALNSSIHKLLRIIELYVVVQY